MLNRKLNAEGSIILVKIADLKLDTEAVEQFGTRCQCGKKLRYGFIVFNAETEEYKMYGSECIKELFTVSDNNIKAWQKEEKKTANAENRKDILHILDTINKKYYTLNNSSRSFYESCRIQAQCKMLSNKQIKILKSIEL